MTEPQRTIAEFFAGIGLMRIGLEYTGWSIAFANDIDEVRWQKAKLRLDGIAECEAWDERHHLN